jgi:hypothetical protein
MRELLFVTEKLEITLIERSSVGTTRLVTSRAAISHFAPIRSVILLGAFQRAQVSA